MKTKVPTPLQRHRLASFYARTYIWNIYDLKRVLENSGSKFLSPANMKAWKSRLSTSLYSLPTQDAYLFITSDMGPYGYRVYTIRYAQISEGGKRASIIREEIYNVQYTTLQAAKKAAAKYHREDIDKLFAQPQQVVTE